MQFNYFPSYILFFKKVFELYELLNIFILLQMFLCPLDGATWESVQENIDWRLCTIKSLLTPGNHTDWFYIRKIQIIKMNKKIAKPALITNASNLNIIIMSEFIISYMTSYGVCILLPGWLLYWCVSAEGEKRKWGGEAQVWSWDATSTLLVADKLSWLLARTLVGQMGNILIGQPSWGSWAWGGNIGCWR